MEVKKNMPKSKGRKPKAPTGQWRRTYRKVNGEERLVKVKRNADGTETVHVVAPRKKAKKSTRTRSKKRYKKR